MNEIQYIMLNVLYDTKKEQQDNFGDHDIGFSDGFTSSNLLKRSNFGYLV